MNAGMAHAHESRFGPPSDRIDIQKFIQTAHDTEASETSPTNVFSTSPESLFQLESWRQLSTDQQADVADQCSVADIKTSLEGTWHNPRLSGHMVRTHEVAVTGLHGTADKSKRKRKRSAIESSQEHPEATALQHTLNQIKLSSWQLTQDAALFMRTPKNTDQNVLTKLKYTASSTKPSISPSTHEAIITVTVHNKLTWGSYLGRASQHALLSSQTLGDLYETIPCTSNEIPKELIEDGNVVGYDATGPPESSSGFVICIEGIAYGDGQSEEDYSDKLIKYLDTVPPEKRPRIEKGTNAHDTPLASLSPRLNEPYWLLHQGNCEHFLVFDQIRLQHAEDPASGYPITLQITPPLLDLCRVCSKVPATSAIIGDIRLGESPYVICDPCWRTLGVPKDREGIMVVPLPKYELGW